MYLNGYLSCRIVLLKQRVTMVAAANKHSAAVTSSGEVFTWGANSHGQLGYGTSDSASNPVPRLVESMKGRAVQAVTAAKHHTGVFVCRGAQYTPSIQYHRVVLLTV